MAAAAIGLLGWAAVEVEGAKGLPAADWERGSQQGRSPAKHAAPPAVPRLRRHTPGARAMLVAHSVPAQAQAQENLQGSK